MHYNEANPAERVLHLAEQLPHSRPQLTREGEKTEALIASLQQPQSEFGAELTELFLETLELHLEGIVALLDYDETGDETLLQEGLQMLVESSHGLGELEDAMLRAREEMPLVA